MTRSHSGGAQHTPNSKRQSPTTTYSLSDAHKKMKKQMNLACIEGIWMEAMVENGTVMHTFGVQYENTIQTQFTTTKNTITLMTNACHHTTIKSALTGASARAYTPGKHRKHALQPSRPEGGGRNLGPTRPSGENQGGDGLVNSLQGPSDGTLKGKNIDWVYQADGFAREIMAEFGLTVRLANDQTWSVTLIVAKIGNKKRACTINYYPPSGTFTLTGHSTLRDKYHPFFNRLVANPPQPTNWDDMTEDKIPATNQYHNHSPQMSEVEEDNEDGQAAAPAASPPLIGVLVDDIFDAQQPSQEGQHGAAPRMLFGDDLLDNAPAEASEVQEVDDSPEGHPPPHPPTWIVLTRCLPSQTNRDACDQTH